MAAAWQSKRHPTPYGTQHLFVSFPCPNDALQPEDSFALRRGMRLGHLGISQVQVGVASRHYHARLAVIRCHRRRAHYHRLRRRRRERVPRLLRLHVEHECVACVPERHPIYSLFCDTRLGAKPMQRQRWYMDTHYRPEHHRLQWNHIPHDRYRVVSGYLSLFSKAWALTQGSGIPRSGTSHMERQRTQASQMKHSATLPSFPTKPGCLRGTSKSLLRLPVAASSHRR